ncbi:MAG: YidC/Oxa1 family insertase periplasmic-domain containing protein [Candidatus Omnitrophica bacterium]|nr:YidC/Oxa1 family insertase periplasmic-domain containing protein [Candidatus Omnitrophota bacterium]
MDKRLILAVVLTLLVFLSWTFVVSKFFIVENKEVTSQKAIDHSKAQIQASFEITKAENLVQPPVKQVPLEESTIETTNIIHNIIFNEPDATVKKVIFPKYQSYDFELGKGFLLKNFVLPFKKVSSTENSITFAAQDKDKKIIKEFSYSKVNYYMELEVSVVNLTDGEVPLDLDLQAATLSFKHNNEQERFQDILFALEEKDVRVNGRKDGVYDEVRFLGWRDRYFCGIIQPELSHYSAVTKSTKNVGSDIFLDLPETKLLPRQIYKEKFRIYLGPQDLNSIMSVNTAWSSIIHYGTFDFISQILAQFINFLYSFSHNWGIAIILFSFAIYLILYPLTLKQMKSMKEMQILQPKLEELKVTYKDNPQKLNKEIMELYKIHKVNPFGGCLPLILQLPIFFALYQLLMRSVHLKGAQFLWISDLSMPDRLALPFTLPIIGDKINILPIFMALIMFFQQKLSSFSMGNTSNEQQKMMAIIMPLMFGFFFYNMPAGLVLYWSINSTLTFLYQLKVNRSK